MLQQKKEIFVQPHDIEWEICKIEIIPSETFGNIRKKVIDKLFGSNYMPTSAIDLFFEKEKIFDYNETVEGRNLKYGDERINYIIKQNPFDVNVLYQRNNDDNLSYQKIVTYGSETIKELKGRVIHIVKLDWKIENTILLSGRKELINKELVSNYEIGKSMLIFFFLFK
jgi:hypothetical protein